MTGGGPEAPALQLQDLDLWDGLADEILDVAFNYGLQTFLETPLGRALPKLRAFRLTALSFTSALSECRVTLYNGQTCAANLEGLDTFCAKLMGEMARDKVDLALEDCHGTRWEEGMKVWWAYV